MKSRPARAPAQIVLTTLCVLPILFALCASASALPYGPSASPGVRPLALCSPIEEAELICKSEGGGEGGAPPAETLVNVSPPSIEGTAKVGSTLTIRPGTWSGTSSSTQYTFTWERCDASGEECAPIEAATASTYELLSADNGHTIRVVEEASELGVPAAPAISAVTSVVSVTPPSNTVLPSISGKANVGGILTATDGTWTPTPGGYAHIWELCDASGGECQEIKGATEQSYTLAAEDEGKTIRVQEIATLDGAEGSPALSAATAVVGPDAGPLLTMGPSISGEAEVGGTLTEHAGTWANEPTSFNYQWERCAQGACVAISGATGQAYVLDTWSVGSQLRVKETATNADGATVAYSSSTAVVPTSVIATAAPSIQASGALQPGVRATGDPGTWKGTPEAFAYQWSSCGLVGLGIRNLYGGFDAYGRSCTPIAGATARTYTPTKTDVGDTLLLQVTASVGGASGSASSAESGEVVFGKVEAEKVVEEANIQDWLQIVDRSGFGLPITPAQALQVAVFDKVFAQFGCTDALQCQTQTQTVKIQIPAGTIELEVVSEFNTVGRLGHVATSKLRTVRVAYGRATARKAGRVAVSIRAEKFKHQLRGQKPLRSKLVMRFVPAHGKAQTATLTEAAAKALRARR